MAGTGIYGELLKAQLENLASDPASTSVGRLYWNTTTQSPRVYTSSGWDDLGSAGSSSGRNYLSDWFDSYKVESVGTSAATSTGNRTVAGNTDPTKWVTSDLTNLTFARSADTTLRQSYNYLINSGDANADFVESPLFTLDGVDLGKPITVSFDCAGVSASDDYQVCAVRYDSSGTYQEVITIAGTASATTPYSARIPTGTTKFQGFFIAGSTASDQYAIRFMKHAVNVDLRIDSLYVGPEKVVQGAGISDWVAWTPTGSWSTNATYTGKWRRVGDSMECEIYIALSGAPTGTLSALNLPSGYTIDTAKLNQSTTNKDSLGSIAIQAAGTANYMGTVAYSSTTAVRPFVINAGGTYAVDSSITATAPNTFANGDFVSAHFKVPIVGWSSNVTMADRAVERYYATSDTWDAAGSTTIENVKGQKMGGSLTATRSKVITYNHVASPTDKVAIELSWDGVNWVNSDQIAPYQLSTAGGDLSGVYLSASSSTSATVTFAQYRAAANDDSPTSNWLSSMYWRLRVTSGGAAVGYPIHADNIIVDHNTTQVSAAIESGTYTPTFTNVSNVASTTLRSARYMRVGNVVSVAIQVAIATTAAAPTATQMRVTVPIASNFTTEYQASGGGARFRSTAANEALYIETDSTNNELDVYFYSTITSASDTSIHFTYEIV